MRTHPLQCEARAGRSVVGSEAAPVARPEGRREAFRPEAAVAGPNGRPWWQGRGSSHETDLHRAIPSPRVVGRTDRSALLLVPPSWIVLIGKGLHDDPRTRVFGPSVSARARAPLKLPGTSSVKPPRPAPAHDDRVRVLVTRELDHTRLDQRLAPLLFEPLKCVPAPFLCDLHTSCPAESAETIRVIRPQDDRRLRQRHLWEPGSNTRMARSCGSSR